jgi:hypothetical protein
MVYYAPLSRDPRVREAQWSFRFFPRFSRTFLFYSIMEFLGGRGGRGGVSVQFVPQICIRKIFDTVGNHKTKIYITTDLYIVTTDPSFGSKGGVRGGSAGAAVCLRRGGGGLLGCAGGGIMSLVGRTPFLHFQNISAHYSGSKEISAH